jgi:AAA15 family ATPase/GTPase
MKLTTNSSLTSIYLSNFRSIIGPHEIRLAPVTFFYGPNSAGKSAVYAAIKLISDICKRIEPLSFVDKLRHAVRNHDYELDMIIGLSATFYDLPTLDELHLHSITRDFAEIFPRLIQYFYDTRQPNSDEEKKPVEIGIRYSFDFERRFQL